MRFKYSGLSKIELYQGWEKFKYFIFLYPLSEGQNEGQVRKEHKKGFKQNA